MDKNVLLEKYIGEPVSFVKSELEEKGYSVTIQKCSKPKIKTDCELVVSLKSLSDNKVVIIVGDFLVNI